MPAERVTADMLARFVEIAGADAWAARIRDLRQRIACTHYSGRATQQRHLVELALERLRRTRPDTQPTAGERALLTLAAATVTAHAGFGAPGRRALRAALAEALAGENTLVPLFHVVRTATIQRERGFSVRFARLEEGAPYDLLLRRDGTEAEIACDVVSAEDGRGVHRGAWMRLMDRIDPDLQTWLAAHPGRYLFKLTLPQGLRTCACHQDRLAALHARIRDMLAAQRRADHDEAAVLRLDPLMLAGAQADELGLLSQLRREFGHEAHLAVTAAGGGVCVMAARAGRENDVAVAIRKRMAAVAPDRLSGTRPGILAMFVEDTDRAEWRHLREHLQIEGEARQFLTHPEARRVVAVTCTSRFEMLGAPCPDAAPDGELRFRNPLHPAAKTPALAPAVLSSV